MKRSVGEMFWIVDFPPILGAFFLKQWVIHADLVYVAWVIREKAHGFEITWELLLKSN